MKFLKKLLKYVGVLALLLVSVAGFKVANFLLNKPAEEQEVVEPSGEAEESALTKIVDKIMAMDTAEFNFNFDVVAGEEEIGVSTNILLDMGKTTTLNEVEEESAVGGMKISASGIVEVGAQTINFNVSYLNDYIFADIAGMKIKLQASNALEDISSIMALSLFEKFGLNIELPEISLENFDTSLLIKLTESLVEEKSETGNKVSLDLLGYGDVVLFTDAEYSLEKIVIESLEFEGVKVSGNINSAINAQIPAIVEPADKEEMLDMSNVSSIMSSVDLLIQKGYISGNINLNVLDADLQAKYQIDFKDFNDIKAYFETEIASQKLVVMYQDNKVYFAFDGHKYFIEVSSFDFNQLIEKVEDLANKLGYELPKVEIPQIKTEDALGLLTLIQDFALTDNEIVLDFDIADLKILLNNKEFSEINARYEESVELNITLAEEIEKENFNLDEFVSIVKLEEKINTVINQIKEKKIATTITLSLNETQITTNIFVDLNNGLKARINGEFEGYVYDIIYRDNFVYVNVNELKIKYEIPNLTIYELVDEIETLLQQYIPEFELPEIDTTEIEKQFADVDFATIMALASQIDFTVISAKEDILNIEVNGLNLLVNLSDDKLANITVNYETYSLNVEILDNDFEIEAEGKYVRINETLDYIPAIIDFVNAKKYAFVTTLNINDIFVNINGKLDITNGIKAQLVIEVEGYEVTVTYLNDKVYIDYAGKTIEGDVDEIADLIKDLIPSEEKSEQNTVETESQKVSFDILKDIIQNGNVLEIALNMGLNIMLTKEDSVLTGLAFAYDDYSLALELSIFNDEITHTSGETIYLKDIVSVANSAIDLVNKGEISGNITLTINDQTFNAKYVVDFNDIKAYIETEIATQKLVVMYQDNNVYVAFDELKYFVELDTFNFEEMLAKLEELAGKLGYELPEIELPEIKAEEALGLLTLIKDFNLTSEEINLILDKVVLDIILDNKEFSAINFNYDNNVELNITLAEEIEKENFNLDEFVSIAKLEEKINAILSEIKEKKFASVLSVDLGEETISTTIYLDFANGLKARLNGEYGEIKYDVIYLDGYIYVNINDLKVKYELPDLTIVELVDEIESLLQQYIPEFELPEIEVEELISKLQSIELESALGAMSQVKFEVVSAQREYVEIQIAGISLKVNMTDDSIVDFSVDYQNNSLNVEILDNDFEIEVEEKYVRINETLDYIPAIIDFVNAKKYSISTTMNIEGIDVIVNGNIDITEGLKAQFELSLSGEKIYITYINDVLYIDYNNISIKGTLEEIKELINELMPQSEDTNVEIDTTNLNILEDIISNGDLLEVILTNGLSVTLEKEGNTLSGIELAYENFEIALELSVFEGEITYAEKASTINLTEIYDFANVIVDFVQNETLAFEIAFSFEDLAFTGKAIYEEGEISAYIETTIGNRVLMIVVKDEQIYLNFDGFALTCKIDEIDDLVEYVTTYAGIELPSVDEEAINVDVPSILTKLFVALEEKVMKVTFEDLMLNIVTTNDTLNYIELSYADIVATITPCEKFEIQLEGNYINLYEMKELSKAVYNSVKNLSISGTIEVTLNMFGEDNFLSIDYAIGYRDNKLMGYIETEFKGLAINAYVDGEDIYLYVVGLQIHLNVNELQDLVDWVNATFNADLSLDFIEDTIEDLKEIKLDLIASVETQEGITNVVLKNGMKIDVEYGDYLETIRFIDGGREAIITCTDFSLINLDSLVRDDYRDYTEFTPLIANLYNFAMSNKYSVSANAQVYEGQAMTMNVSGDVQLDVTNGLNAYVDLNGLGEQITLHYDNKKLYFAYAGLDGLKISIGEEAIQEIAAILLSAMGLDVSSIPYLEEILQKEDLDTGNLGSVLPKIEFGNPLSYLEYIRDFEVTDEYFSVNIKGEKLSDYAAGKDVSIKIYYSEGKVTKLAVSNFYTAQSQFANIEININTFEGVSKLDQTAKDTYIDLTNSKDLVKALVHTSQLNDYHIQGKINLTIDFLAEMTAATLNVDARVQRKEVEYTYIDETTGKLVKETKNELTGVIVLDNYPLISVLNAENANGGVGILAFLTGSRRYRSITIVLKDGYAYVMTEDEKYEDYEMLTRATKVTTDFLLGNISYYIKYLLGFVDGIQTKIDAMIQESMNYSGPVLYGDIIKSYSMNGRTHNIVLNMAQIAHNSDIQDMTLNITTKNDAETNYKDYLYKLDLSVVMLDGIITISTDPTKDTSLYLVDIGKPVDMSVGEQLIKDYDVTYALGFDGEWEKEGSGVWKQANTGTVTVTFKSNDQIYRELTGNISSKLDLPKPANYTVKDGVIVTEYKFVGWYTDSEYSKQFTANAYPRYNTVLYAKWEVASVNKEVTITFETNEASLSQSSLTKFAGSTGFTLPTLSNVKYEPDENTVILRTFQGWFTADGVKFESKTFPSENITLYAKWTEEITETYHLDIYFDDVNVFNSDVPAGIFESNILNSYDAFFDEAGNKVTDFTIEEDTVWIAKNEYSLVITSLYGKTGQYSYENVMYNGDAFVLPDFEDYEIDMTTYIIEYKFLGYFLNGNSNTYVQGGNRNIQPQNESYVAQWQIEEYCYVTFTTDWYTPKSWVNTLVSKITPVDSNKTAPEKINGGNAIKIKKGQYFSDLEKEYNASVSYYYKAVGINGRYDFFVAAWNTEGIGMDFDLKPDNKGYKYSPIGAYTVTSHVHFYAYWDAIYSKA